MNRLSILVVDDEESLRRIMRMQLEEMGYAALEAASGPMRSRCWLAARCRW